MKQQIRAELKQGIVRRWYQYILPFALGAVSTAAFLSRYALLEAWTGELRAASFGDCFAYIFRGMQEYIPNQHQPFEVPVLFLRHKYSACGADWRLCGRRAARNGAE